VSNLGLVKLKKGKESIIKFRHPWIFSGAIDKVENVEENGQLVLVSSSNNQPLAIGSYSFYSQIAVRIWSFDISSKVDKSLLLKRFNSALELRKNIINRSETNAFRVINSESDHIPGLIIDFYAGYYVIQFLSAGVEYFRKEIIEIISNQSDCIGIYERSDSDVRIKENLPLQTKLLFGDSIPEKVLIKENGICFGVDIQKGHKTGFYLDQRDNRLILKNFCKNKNILNCFCYTGGFSAYALTNGANYVVNIDSSAKALELANENHRLNFISDDMYENIEADVFKTLRTFREENRKFDIVILDPPKFADSAANIQKAARAYKYINLLSLQLLNHGGFLFTFSCSGHISRDLFNKIVNDAALDAGREIKFLSYLNQSKDHPILSSFPESYYLKGLLCYVN
jgi:23S rRNA (cytosine1962-C5)-methyltransferase